MNTQPFGVMDVVNKRNGVDLVALFPDQVKADERQGYSGFIIEPKNLVEVFRILRDDYGYDYLSSVTGVDYYPDDKMEVVYHLYRSSGGSGLILRTQVSRDNPVVPSLTPLYPGANFQEREAWDLLGIRFSGHPDLRRILLWEGFAGHPLRKDWKEPYFEQETKPFRSRFPQGKVYRSEDKNTFGDNVQYPPGFDPKDWQLEESSDEAIYRILRESQQKLSSELKTETVIVNMGPQHPSTHGVFRMAVLLDGETVLDLKPVFGYLHRNHEKIGERNTYLQNMPYTDRLDYITSMSNNFGYALAVEKLLGIQPTERAEYIRVMMAELTRMSSHFIAIGFLLNDLGAFFTPSLYGLEERELILDIFEAVSGSRMMCNYFRFGGVARDLPEGVLEKVRDLVNDRLPRKVDDIDRYLTNNEIVRARCEGVGVLRPEQAIALSTTGPLLRSTGIPYDIRRAEPYGIYDRFEFDVMVGSHGDIYDRYLVRLGELRESIRILKQVIRDIPQGPVQEKVLPYGVRVPPGEAYSRIESPKGELGFYVVSNGTSSPWRYHVRSSAFVNLTSLETMARGYKVADLIAIFGSIDITLGEVDR